VFQGVVHGRSTPVLASVTARPPGSRGSPDRGAPAGHPFGWM